MDAIILAGAVAKGAFAAGALSVLLDPRENPQGLRIRRVVAASSGALNGAYLAAAVHRGADAEAGAALRALWLERAEALRVFAPSARGIAALEGFSTGEKVLALLREQIRPAPAVAPVDLRVVVTATVGQVTPGDAPAATTFEHVAPFDGRAFESEAALEPLYAAVLASAAFPGAFLPYPIQIAGQSVPCVDGGAVNNAPVKHAIADPDVSRVVVITSYPRLVEPNGAQRNGAGLLAHLAEIVVNERLYRDLREARAVNRALAELEANVTSPTLRALILRALGWTGRRPIEIVEVRPAGPLEGNAFAGFFSRRLRERYVETGALAARATLRELNP